MGIRLIFHRIKLNNPFNTWGFLVAMLIFGSPFSTFAQQDAVMLEAKAAAEKDAKHDVNKLAWFTTGLVRGTLIGFGGAIGGCIIGAAIDPPDEAGFLYFSVSDGQMLGTLVGLVGGASIPLFRAHRYKINLPPERFIGKSPEYIDHYTDAYRKKARSIRKRTTAAGIIAPGCLIGLAILAGG